MLLAVLASEAMLQLFPALLPERHEYLARRIANQNLRSLLDFVHRDEPHVHHRPGDTFRYHPQLGWTSTPGLERRIWGYDGYFGISTNSLGFRDREVDRSSPNPRIMVLGDSFVWGLFLDQPELMPQQLERALRESGHEVDVYNFGMAGFGSDQELLTLREFGPIVRPAIVVLAFFYSNDFKDNDRSTSRSRGGRAKPYFSLAANGEAVLHNVPVPAPETSDDAPPAESPVPDDDADAVRTLRRTSVLANLLAGAFQPPRSRDRSARAALPGGRITRAILLEVEREAQRQRARLVVMLFPGYGYYAGRRAEYERAREFFRSELPEIDLVDLTPDFDRSGAVLYGRFVEHWNAAGSHLAAQLLARHLIDHHADALRRAD